MQIAITYKCKCMAAEETIMIDARQEGEEIIWWMDNTLGPAIAKDHRWRSPVCIATTMEYVKIPVEDDRPIGGPMKEH